MKKLLFALLLTLCTLTPTHAQLLPPEADDACEQWVVNELLRMPLKARIGQLLIYTTEPANVPQTKKILARTIKQAAPGGFMFTGAPDLKAQAQLTNHIQAASPLPTLIGTDPGTATHANMPLLLHASALSCITDTTLVEAYNQLLDARLNELGIHILTTRESAQTQPYATYAFGREPDIRIHKTLHKRHADATPDLEIEALMDGNDMVTTKNNPEKVVTRVLMAIQDGRLTEKEIEAKCRRVLAYKYRLGLQQKPRPIAARTGIHTPEAEALMSRLRTEAITVPANHAHVLPLDPTAPGRMAVLSIGGNDKDFVQTLGTYAAFEAHTLNPQTTPNELHTLLQQLADYRRIIVSVSTEAFEIKQYAHLLNELRTKAPLIYVFFTPQREPARIEAALARAAAVVVAHSTHTDVQQHTAHIICAQASAQGRLSAPIGNLFAAGSGSNPMMHAPAPYVPEDYGMKSHVLHRGIDSIVNAELARGAFPGCQVLVLKDGMPVYDKNFGTHAPNNAQAVQATDLFDVGELTQTAATLPAIMKLYDDGRLGLDEKASTYVPALRTPDKKNITIRQLLMHESGLPPNIRFHRQIIDPNSVQGPYTQAWQDEHHQTQVSERTWASSDFKYKQGLVSNRQTATHGLQMAENLWLANAFKNTMLKEIAAAAVERDKRYVYSPAGFILLQQVVEAIVQMPLDAYLEKEFYAPMGLDRTKFLPLRHIDAAHIMPTAQNEYLRRQDLCGYVLDEMAACQGGVSGNAGLFSTAHQLAQIHQMLLNGGVLNGRRYLSEATCKLFTTERSAHSRRGPGFDHPAAYNPAAPLANPCSPATPLQVFGHAASTGCCAWADPENNLVYVFLSNRNCPNTWNDLMIQAKTLKNIQELIYQSLDQDKL